MSILFSSILGLDEQNMLGQLKQGLTQRLGGELGLTLVQTLKQLLPLLLPQGPVNPPNLAKNPTLLQMVTDALTQLVQEKPLLQTPQLEFCPELAYELGKPLLSTSEKGLIDTMSQEMPLPVRLGLAMPLPKELPVELPLPQPLLKELPPLDELAVTLSQLESALK